MEKPTIILATSNGIGMGHLTRASAVAAELKSFANPIIISMASGVVEVPKIADVGFEYVPGRDRKWMGRFEWDRYLRDRIVALIDETDAKIVSFDGVVPYPGIIGIKSVRPKVKLVWVRRGFWQKTPQRYLLDLQSKMMDLIITPGDYGQSYDKGPTANRKDSLLVKPISIFNPKTALSKADARNLLSLDLNRPAVLVQLGIGEADLNAKMTATLKGLISWPNLQVVLTKDPIDSEGVNLAPDGLDLKVIRHFPLANVLSAFDAAICAAGYNSVHEELAAKIPTLFIPNIRGTDNQAARAAWAADNKVALTVDQSDLSHITLNASKLIDLNLRAELSKNCTSLPAVTGATEVAVVFKDLLMKPAKDEAEIAKTLFRLKLQDIFGRGWRGTVYAGLQLLTVLYRMIKPHKEVKISNSDEVKIYQGNDDNQLRTFIKSGNPFEHLLSGASAAYKDRRIEIASKAYLK
jgi:spore coat polysaccharide biosynthesis predicted glycosyltransferase SpsG